MPSRCIGSTKYVAPGTEEMAQLSKFLPYKHGDLSWIYKTIFFFLKSENVMCQSSTGGGHATAKQQKAWVDLNLNGLVLKFKL